MARRIGSIVVFLLCAGTAAVHPQEVPFEYQVKAAYLFNFVKFVEWPADASTGPLTICVAGKNPFGDLLTAAVDGEAVHDRPLVAKVISQPDPACHVVFMPQGAAAAHYLKALRDSPTLTVGETPGFLADGGMINFIIEEGKVRFQIDADAASRADLRISSHLLRLARAPGRRG